MYAVLFRTVEVVFTAYAVPALIVPLVWLLARMFGPRSVRPWEQVLKATESFYGLLAIVWILAGSATLAGLRVELSGGFGQAAAWLLYGLLNLAFASLLVRFTAGFGHIKEEEEEDRDRLFARLLWIVVAHPVATAFAFVLLYRVMGAPYALSVPGLGAVQEGI